MSFNINDLQLNDTTTFTLTSPGTGEYLYAGANESLPLTVTIYGRSSKQYRQWLAAANRAKLARGKKTMTTEAEQIETAEFLAVVTKSVANFDLDGAAIDTDEMKKKLYLNPGLFWIGDQVAEALGALDGFLTK